MTRDSDAPPELDHYGFEAPSGARTYERNFAQKGARRLGRWQNYLLPEDFQAELDAGSGIAGFRVPQNLPPVRTSTVGSMIQTRGSSVMFGPKIRPLPARFSEELRMMCRKGR